MRKQLSVLFFIISIFSFLYAQEGGGISLPSQNTGNMPTVNLPPSEVLQKLKENQNILKENKTIINKEQIQNQLTGQEENQENKQFKEEVKQTETNNLAVEESSELEININNLFKDILKDKN
jgi:hypothetical protein